MRTPVISPELAWRERSVFEVRQEGSLRFPAGLNQIYARRLLRYQIRRDPHDIGSHVRLILSCLDPSLRKPLLAALADLYIALGNKGKALRITLLNLAKPYITKADYGFFRSAEENGLDKQQPIPYPGSLLAAGYERLGQGHSSGDFIEALSSAMKLLGKGELEPAQASLEEAMLKYPHNRDIELALIDVYRRTKDSASYRAMTRQLGLKQITPSSDWRDLGDLFPAPASAEADGDKGKTNKNRIMRPIGLDLIPVLRDVVAAAPGSNPNRSLFEESGNSRIRGCGIWRSPFERVSFCSKRADIDLGDPGKRIALYFAPEIYFLSPLLRVWNEAKERRKPMILDVLGEKTVVFPEEGSLWTSIKPTSLADICIQKLPAVGRIPMRPITLQEIDIYKIQQSIDANHASMTDSFVWMVAVLTARGRVPKGVDFEAPVSLREWPNMTRLLHVPGAMRVAALWQREAISLSETARRLNLPQRYVFTFYTAALSLGLVVAGDAEQQPSQPEENESGTFFKRLAHLLHPDNTRGEAA